MALDGAPSLFNINQPVLLAAADGSTRGVSAGKLADTPCREIRSKADPDRSMRLCGDLPHPTDVFSFSASEGLLLQVAEVSPAYANAVIALRNFSQHGGLEYALDTQMNVNTNLSREQTVRLIRREAMTKEEADALKVGGRESFAVRISRSDNGKMIVIDMQSLRDNAPRLSLRLSLDRVNEYVVRDWQMN
jgi:hypothetical protein